MVVAVGVLIVCEMRTSSNENVELVEVQAADPRPILSGAVELVIEVPPVTVMVPSAVVGVDPR